MTTLSNYPGGFNSGVSLRNVPLYEVFGNNVYWVSSSTGLNGNNGTRNKPFATLAYALTICASGKGDVIMIKPGHTETVAAAAGITFGTITGVTVIGLGTGALRPTFNFTATASTITMTAASSTIRNCLFTGGIDAVVSWLVVSAADCALIDCEYRDVTGQCTDGILTTAAANRLMIKNFRHEGDTAAGTNAGIAIVGGDGIVIEGLRMDGNFAVGGVDIRTTATTDLEIRDVVFRTRNSADIFLVDTITASTGVIGPNINLRLQDNAPNITEALTGATFVYHLPISIVNFAGEVGMSTNITASTDA